MCKVSPAKVILDLVKSFSDVKALKIGSTIFSYDFDIADETPPPPPPPPAAIPPEIESYVSGWRLSEGQRDAIRDILMASDETAKRNTWRTVFSLKETELTR